MKPSDGIINLFDRLVDQFKQLPGVGPKTAARFAYHLLRQPEEISVQLAEAIVHARNRLNSCAECCDFSEQPVCAICSNPARTDSVLCVVEEPSDVVAFERSREFKGKYHVLHGKISPLDGIDEGQLRIRQLQDRIGRQSVDEVILATNPTAEGDTTALYIARLIKSNTLKVSRIAHGIPVGGEIEYLDGATLGKAIQNRVSL